MSDLLTQCLDFPHRILPSLSTMQLVQRVLHCSASGGTAGDETIAQAALSFAGTYSPCLGSLPWDEKAVCFPPQGMACEHEGFTKLSKVLSAGISKGRQNYASCFVYWWRGQCPDWESDLAELSPRSAVCSPRQSLLQPHFDNQ